MRKSPIAVAILFTLVSILTLAPNPARSQETSEGTRKVLLRVPPQYPSVARTMRIEGVVKVDVLVAPNGTVKSIEVKGGHPMLAQSAENAIRQWKWEPSPRETHENIELRFSL